MQYRMFASMSLFSLCVHTPTCDDTSVLCGLGELGERYPANVNVIHIHDVTMWSGFCKAAFRLVVFLLC